MPTAIIMWDKLIFHEKVEAPNGCSAVNFVRITRQLEATQKLNNLHQIKGVILVRLRLFRHAFWHFTDATRSRLNILRKPNFHLLRPVVDDSTKTGIYGTNDFRTTARELLGAIRASILWFDSTFLFTWVTGGVVALCFQSRAKRRQ